MPELPTITDYQRTRIVKLLGELKTLLEAEIECHALPCGGDPPQPEEREILRAARAKWHEAQQMMRMLEAANG